MSSKNLTEATMKEMLSKVTNCMMTMKNSGMKEKFPVSLIDMECWEWPQGVGLYGLYLSYRTSGKKETLDFLIQWFDRHVKERGMEKNVNTTAPMLTLSYLYEETGKPEYLDMIREWTDWMMDENGLLRAGDGCFQHMITGDPNTGEILIDTLFMAVLFLARAGRILNRPECNEEAEYQILSHIRYLHNHEAGLFYHGWNFPGNHNYGKVMWGRGNGWYTIGLMEYLKENNPSPALKRYFLSVYESQVKALKNCQDPELGVWHTVLTNPDSYVEISASAAFLAGIMKGIRQGVLTDDYLTVVKNGVKAIISYIDEAGVVQNVSYGTPIGWDEDFYKEIPCCPITYGQAMMILMLQELMDPYWSRLLQ